MTIYYDTPVIPVSRFSRLEVYNWLAETGAHRGDCDWLFKHSDEIFHAIRIGFTFDRDLPTLATRVLLDISRTMLSAPDPEGRWWTLYVDALTEALNRRDHRLLQEIYAHYGQASLKRGDTGAAWHLFCTLIENDPDLLQREQWTPDDWYLAEQKLLAYIGMLQLETWHNNHADDQHILDALALAERMHDHLMTSMLYHSLACVLAFRHATADAIGYAQTSLGYALRRNDYSHALDSALVLVAAYRKAGLLDAARRALALAESLSKRVEMPLGSARVTYELGVWEYIQNNFDAAEALIRQAHETFLALGHERHMTMCEQVLGNILLEQSQYSDAEQLLSTTLAHWTRNRNVYGQTNTLLDLAKVYWRVGNPEAALDYAEQALERVRNMPPVHSRDWLIERIESFRMQVASSLYTPNRTALAIVPFSARRRGNC